ncbi:MAG: asparagine synthase (glutamine-hydrolyzing) [Oscillospiraceae bacterium]|jgi:asparagine synthase (glutamine-hydrolysing)|nr:asparagine synthase (glutamine-hydrolyzing) [Oscillospiraceae bacterium]
MCGIAGWLDDSIDFGQKTTVVEEMSKTLARRGPDENGTYYNKGAVLIHRRLSVIDPQHGKQPMTLKTRNHKYTIVYNGELYNTAELRNELKALGWIFESTSDTEVLLKGYAQWKADICQKLNGIYAFAVYDAVSGGAFLCRDRVGVKPLFYYKYDGGLIFGSELKTLLKSGYVKPIIDKQGLSEIFFLGPARTPGCGVFKGVEELKPGEYASYRNGLFVKQQYFKLTAREHSDNEAQTIEKTRYLLTDAIEKQLVSDVPMCFFLSGGLDSSIIVKVASEFAKRNKQAPITTYNVDYEDNSKFFKASLFQPNSDADYIGLMSQDAQSVHKTVTLNNREVADALYAAALARDLPGMADVDSSLLLFCAEMKKSFTVALSGECADELFGGYPWYHNEEILFTQGFPWSRSLDIRRQILAPGLLPDGEEYVNQRYADTVRSTEKLKTDTTLSGRMREMFALNYYWFMQCLLDRKDRMSMYNGFEVRVPFCDYRVVEYAYNMPWELKAHHGREKGIVRTAFEDLLPHDITYRKKSPYPKTHNPLYFEITAKRVREILRKKTPITELLNKNGIEEIINNPDSISSPWYGQLMRAPQILAYIIQFDFWARQLGVEFEV